MGEMLASKGWEKKLWLWEAFDLKMKHGPRM